MKVGDKMFGFKFENGTNDIVYTKGMIQYEGQEGEILRFGKANNIIVKFKDGAQWSYPILINTSKTDSIVESVIGQYRERSEVGIKKYNNTMDRKDLSNLDWLTHLQQELMDATLYIEKLKNELK